MQDTFGCAIWDGDNDGYIHAHAHTEMGRRNRGWICLATTDDLTLTIVLHETAHLILGDSENHGEPWKRMVRHLGGRVERRYL